MRRRRIPRPSELRALVRTKPIVLDRTVRRLSEARTIGDLRAIAARRVPRAVFDYVDGGADEEMSLRRARAAFNGIEFHPQVLRDVAVVETGTTILGRPATLPLVLAPTGFTRMMHHEGERAVASVAAQIGIPYTLSTMGTTSIEEVAQAAPHGTTWFQLYVWRDRGLSKELVDRAQSAGYQALVLTVDVPVAGQRLRDVRNGMTIPPSLSLRTLLDAALHPSWWFNLLTTEPLSFASMGGGSPETLSSIIQTMFDPSVTFEDVSWLRGTWSGPVVIKGILGVEDAIRVADLGVDGIVVSNHGGRQLDRAVTPLDVLPSILEAVGDRVEVYIDTGVRSGSDIVAAVALGATACLVGRAYLYGLMAGGRRGVERALGILASETTRTLQLLGVRSISELTPSFVALRP